MKRLTQREQNPYKLSDSNKRYQTFDYYLKKRFGGKCAKISLDAGFRCPNLDGTVGVGGCIYCSGGSSGAQCVGSLREQYEEGVRVAKNKWETDMFIPYLQAFTNTYAPLEKLRAVYEEAISFPGAVMLAVATRADCLGDGVVALLSEISEKMPVLVELGLQSSNDKTAEIIGRGHSFETFVEGYNSLKNAPGDISVCIHLINGLPGETEEMMIESAAAVAKLCPHMVKLHLLHVLKNTRLAKLYENGEYNPMEEKDYVRICAEQIELFSPETVIARLTGDGVGDKLLAPHWSRKKTAVINDIDKYMFENQMYQGKKFAKTEKI